MELVTRTRLTTLVITNVLLIVDFLLMLAIAANVGLHDSVLSEGVQFNMHLTNNWSRQVFFAKNQLH